jgi:hypothetical protein
MYKKLPAINLNSLQQEYSSVGSWFEPIGVCYSDLMSSEQICYQVISGSMSFQFNESGNYSNRFHIITINEGERIVIEKDTVYSLILGNLYQEEKTLHTKYYIADNSICI